MSKISKMSKSAQRARQEQIARERGLLPPERSAIKTDKHFFIAPANKEEVKAYAPAAERPKWHCDGCPERGHRVTHNGVTGRCIDGSFWTDGEIYRMRQIDSKYGAGTSKQVFMSEKIMMLRDVLDLDFADADITQ